MKKNHFKRNLSNILIFLIFIVIVYLSLIYGWINTKGFNSQNHINILTVNSIFAGFLFTSLGIIAGFMDKTRIANLDKNGYMDKYYNSIYTGLMFHIISAVMSAYAFVQPSVNDYKLYLLIEQISLLGGIIFFISSTIHVKRIINKIRNN